MFFQPSLPFSWFLDTAWDDNSVKFVRPVKGKQMEVFEPNPRDLVGHIAPRALLFSDPKGLHVHLDDKPKGPRFDIGYFEKGEIVSAILNGQPVVHAGDDFLQVGRDFVVFGSDWSPKARAEMLAEARLAQDLYNAFRQEDGAPEKHFLSYIREEMAKTPVFQAVHEIKVDWSLSEKKFRVRYIPKSQRGAMGRREFSVPVGFLEERIGDKFELEELEDDWFRVSLG